MKQFLRSIKRKIGILKALGIVSGKEGRIILIGSPLHDNLGDHAITIAEKAFFNDSFPAKRFCDISGDDFRNEEQWIKQNVTCMDTIVVTGGGFMGSLWMREESLIRKVILAFPKNRIIIMPQTMYYEESEDGICELGISKKIYSSHRDLIIYLRDRKSYQFAQEHFSFVEKIALVPDIVTYLRYESDYCYCKRGNIGVCLRNDKEKLADEGIFEMVEAWGRIHKVQVKPLTTIEDHLVFSEEREEAVYNKLREFSSFQVVVTDRLHGMLFAAITSTPCIALDNASGKVKGVYEWIKNLEYIHFCEECSEIPSLLSNFVNLGQVEYNNEQNVFELKRILEDIT